MGDSGSNYGAGFVIRMVVLLGLLGCVGFGYYYDSSIQKSAEKTIDGAWDLLFKKTDDGFGVPKDEVKKEMGFDPQESFEKDGYEVEVYRFGRALPFMAGQYITVVYQEGALVKMFSNEEFDPEKMKAKLAVKKTAEEDRDPLPNSALNGAAPPANDSSDDDASDDEGDAAEEDGDKKEEAAKDGDK